MFTVISLYFLLLLFLQINVTIVEIILMIDMLNYAFMMLLALFRMWGVGSKKAPVPVFPQ